LFAKKIGESTPGVTSSLSLRSAEASASGSAELTVEASAPEFTEGLTAYASQ